MGSDGDDVGDPRVRPETRTEERLRDLESVIERLERDVSALRQDLLRVATRASEHERQTTERVDRFSDDAVRMYGALAERLDRRNELLAKICGHIFAFLGKHAKPVVWALAASIVIVAVSGSALLLGVVPTNAKWGDSQIEFTPKAQPAALGS